MTRDCEIFHYISFVLLLISFVGVVCEEETERCDVAFIVSLENGGVYSLSNFLISLREEISDYKQEYTRHFSSEILIVEIGNWNAASEEIIAEILSRQHDKFSKQKIKIKVVRNKTIAGNKDTANNAKQLNKAVSNSNSNLLIFVSSILELESNWLNPLIDPISTISKEDVEKSEEITMKLKEITTLYQRKKEYSNSRLYEELLQLTDTKFDDFITIDDEIIQIRAIHSSLLLIKTPFSNLIFSIDFHPSDDRSDDAFDHQMEEVEDDQQGDDNREDNFQEINEGGEQPEGEVAQHLPQDGTDDRGEDEEKGEEKEVDEEREEGEEEKEEKEEEGEEEEKEEGEEEEGEEEFRVNFTYKLEEVNFEDWENDLGIYSKMIDFFFPPSEEAPSNPSNETSTQPPNHNNNDNETTDHNNDNNKNDNKDNNNDAQAQPMIDAQNGDLNMQNVHNEKEFDSAVIGELNIEEGYERTEDEMKGEKDGENYEVGEEEEEEEEEKYENIKKKIELKVIDIIFSHFHQLDRIYEVNIPQYEDFGNIDNDSNNNDTNNDNTNNDNDNNKNDNNNDKGIEFDIRLTHEMLLANHLKSNLLNLFDERGEKYPPFDLPPDVALTMEAAFASSSSPSSSLSPSPSSSPSLSPSVDYSSLNYSSQYLVGNSSSNSSDHSNCVLINSTFEITNNDAAAFEPPPLPFPLFENKLPADINGDRKNVFGLKGKLKYIDAFLHIIHSKFSLVDQNTLHEHLIDDQIGVLIDHLSVLKNNFNKVGMVGSLISTKSNRFFEGFFSYFFTSLQEEKKGSHPQGGFASNLGSNWQTQYQSNPPYTSSNPLFDSLSVETTRSIVYSYSAPFLFPNEISFSDRFEFLQSEGGKLKNQIDHSHRFPMPFVSFQGEHKNYDLLYQMNSDDVFGLSSLSFSIPRLLFDFFGGLDENYKQIVSKSNIMNSATMSPFALPNYSILELNLLLKSTGWKLLFAPQSKATLSHPPPSFDYFHHSNQHQSIDNYFLSDMMLFDYRWNSLLRSLIQSRYVVRDTSLVWDMECGTSGVLGFTIEAINLLIELEKYLPLSITTGTHDTNCFTQLQSLGLPPYKLNSLYRLFHTPIAHPNSAILIVHRDPGRYNYFISRLPFNAIYVIGRSMFETTSIPSEWKKHIEENVDEVWVPSHFNVQTFQSGVSNTTLFTVIPNSVDIHSFSPSLFTRPFSFPKLPNRSNVFENIFLISQFAENFGENFQGNLFAFLSIGKWEERKGWKELLTAYLSEFSSEENVQLVIRSNLKEANNRSQLNSMIESVNITHTQPKIALVDEMEEFWVLPEVYSQANCFVLSSHGEGWGLPYAEAMSMQLPTIAANWSGNTAFMHENNSFLIPVNDFVHSTTPNNLWANINSTQLQFIMRDIFNNYSSALLKGKIAREDISKFDQKEVVGKVLNRIKELVENKEDTINRNVQRKTRYNPPTPPTPPPKRKAPTDSDKKFPVTREINGKIYYVMRIIDM